MALGALCYRLVECFDCVQGRTALGDESMSLGGMGRATPFIGGQRGATLDGVDALVDDFRVAYVMVAEEALQGGASRQLHGLQGRPLGEKVAEDGGVFVLEPLQDMRKVVFESTGEPIREAHLVPAEAAARGHELFEGTHGRTLGLQGLELITMLEQELKLEFGVSGVILGFAGGQCLTIARQREWMNGKEHEKVMLA